MGKRYFLLFLSFKNDGTLYFITKQADSTAWNVWRLNVDNFLIWACSPHLVIWLSFSKINFYVLNFYSILGSKFSALPSHPIFCQKVCVNIIVHQKNIFVVQKWVLSKRKMKKKINSILFAFCTKRHQIEFSTI